MQKVLQKLLNKKSQKYADLGPNELNGRKPGFLYSKKGSVDWLFDFYYIEHGIVYYVNYYYRNDAYHHGALKKLVEISDNKQKPTPKEYLIIAEYFSLCPDYNTFRDVVFEWMNENSYFFFEDIPSNDFPERLPLGFSRIADDVRRATSSLLNSGEVSNIDHIYADLYVINGKVCLITGAGKSDACKAISESDLAYDDVAFRNGDNGLACRFKYATESPFLTVDYCIHMNEDDSEDIIEVDHYHYLQKAQGNIMRRGATLSSFYNALKNSDCKMVIVPYTNSFEKKIAILRDYLYNR